MPFRTDAPKKLSDAEWHAKLDQVERDLAKIQTGINEVRRDISDAPDRDVIAEMKAQQVKDGIR